MINLSSADMGYGTVHHSIKTCPICGKEFTIRCGLKDYAYKRLRYHKKKDNSIYEYFCSWKCFRE